MPRLLAPLMLSLATFMLVACSPPGSPRPEAGAPASAAAQAVTVQGTDALKFVPSTLTVKAGQPITLTFNNTGHTLHDWSLDQGAGQPVKICSKSTGMSTIVN